MADGEKSVFSLVSVREAEKETFSPHKVPCRGSEVWLLANQNSEFPLECSFLGGDNRIIGILLASCKMVSDKESLEIRVIQNELSQYLCSLEINFYFEERRERISETQNKIRHSCSNLNKPGGSGREVSVCTRRDEGGDASEIKGT